MGIILPFLNFGHSLGDFVFARTNEDPKWTMKVFNSIGDVRMDFAFRDVAGEGCWCFSFYDANGAGAPGPVTWKLCLPNETLEWGKQYTLALFETMPESEAIHLGVQGPPETMSLTITNPARALEAVQGMAHATAGRRHFLLELARRQSDAESWLGACQVQ